MPSCPKCHAEINTLFHAKSLVQIQPLSNSSGKVVYGEPYQKEVDILDEYKCPVCGEKVADSENKALEFLGVQPYNPSFFA